MTYSFKFFAYFCLICIGHLVFSQDLSPVVQTAEGSVQGTTKVTFAGRQFYAFQGIPFGKSPVGALRFKAPEPAEPWIGVLQVTSDPPPCIQPSLITGISTVGVEDCLQLNVFTPQVATNETQPLLPVHVYIHGGAFIIGEITYFDVNPERYMNYDMVFVAIKYRLGPLGFLSTDNEDASGNFGLLDQNLALKWIQRNIAAFGGNPNQVTISGQSAGSCSVIFHILSPMSTGLFHRAIGESGSALNPWSLQESPSNYSRALGQHFNCSTDNTTELVDCLRQLSAEDIQGYAFEMMSKYQDMIFVPSVETSPSGKFITEDPLATLQSGNFNHVPLQLGFNRDEGCLVYDSAYVLFQTINDTTFDVIIPMLLYNVSDYQTNLVNVSYAIKDQYYSTIEQQNQTAVNIATIAWMSDISMKSGIAQTAALVSSHDVPTYLYAYNYVSAVSTSHFTGEPGLNVIHTQELEYLLYRPIVNDKDDEFGNRFFHLWAEFIINGTHVKPVGSDDQWLKTPPGQYNYYDINEQFVMRGNYDTEDMEFWWTTVPSIAYASGDDFIYKTLDNL